MRKAILLSVIFPAASVLVGGCIASMMVLENPEWRDGVLVPDMDPDLLEKYTVGDVVVHPVAYFQDDTMARIHLSFGFHSKADTSVISVKSLTVSIGGEELDYGEPISPTRESDWKVSMPPPLPYLCGTRRLTVEAPPGEMPRSRVEFSLVVSVREESGKVTKKKIEAYFLAEKRSSLFGEFPLS